MPAPSVTKKPAAQRSADTKATTESFAAVHIPEESFRTLLGRASNEELHLIASTLEQRSDDYSFQSMMASNAAVSGDVESLASMALLYDPELYPNMDRFARSKYLHEAELQAEDHYRTDIFDDDDDFDEAWDGRSRWDLLNESEATRVKVQNFVKAWSIISAGTNLERPSYEVMDRVMDDSKGDIDLVIAALRKKPSASVIDHDFMVAGGTPAFNDGAL